MTLLIVFLSLTNIALGYGLAIYLGHASVGARKGGAGWGKKLAARKSNRQPVDEEPPVTARPKPAVTKAAAKPLPAEKPLPTSPTKSVPPELSANDRSAETVVEKTTDSEESSLQDTLKDLESFREQFREQDSSPTEEEGQAADPAAEEVPQEETPQAAATHDEEDLLKGIGDFQQQLMKQQELSKVPSQAD